MKDTKKYIFIVIGVFALLFFLLKSTNGEYVSKFEMIITSAITAICVYTVTDKSGELRELQKKYHSETEQQKKTITELKEEIYYLKKATNADLQQVIYNEVVRIKRNSYKEYSAEELTTAIMRNLSHLKITSVRDVKSQGFSNVVKTALCAELGLLDLYQDVSGNTFILSLNNTPRGLSEEEYNKLLNKDYSFIIDEIDELPKVLIK